MSGSGRGTDSRQQEISDISRSLKALAAGTERAGAGAFPAEPCRGATAGPQAHASDPRESGAIEQDADVVMFIY